MIDLASLNKNIEKKMQCTILLVKCLKKLGVVKKYEKKTTYEGTRHKEKNVISNKFYAKKDT